MVAMPLYIWDSSFFANLANLWGAFIPVDNCTRMKRSFASARVLVLTSATEWIFKLSASGSQRPCFPHHDLGQAPNFIPVGSGSLDIPISKLMKKKKTRRPKLHWFGPKTHVEDFQRRRLAPAVQTRIPLEVSLTHHPAPRRGVKGAIDSSQSATITKPFRLRQHR
ncbi:hypothetical protein Ancab_031218 [Ancistrocladus abbreviatus]